MADEKFTDNPLTGEQAQAGPQPLVDPATGASTYLEAAAEGSEINLDDLLTPPPGNPGFSGLPGLQGAPIKPGVVPSGSALDLSDKTGSPSGLASDFPQEALTASSSAPVKSEAAEEKGGRLAFVFVGLKAFWLWFWGKITAIPPLDDLFDRLLVTFGLQRRPAGMLRRANTLALKGRLTEAIKWYRDYLFLRPLSVAGYDGLGRAYFRMGLTEEANREFIIADSMERILHNRDDIDAAAALAESFLDRKQAKISVSLIEPVLIAHFYTPSNKELLKVMGRVYTELRANKKVYQIYQAGLAQYPEDFEFYILKGNAEIRIGNVIEGERLVAWGRLMKKLKENPRDANAKMAMGEMYLKEQKLEEGLSQLREAASLAADNVGVRWRLFNLYQKQSNYDESLKYFLEIVALDSDNEDLRYRLADFYRKNKHRDEALDIYRDLIDKHPRDPKPHILLGELQMDMSDFENGQKMKDLAKILECGLKPNPDHHDTLKFMKYLFSIGQNEEGHQWLDRGLAKWPYHGELILIKVKYLYNEYRYKDAVALLKRIIPVKPDMAEPHIWIAMCYQRLGDNMAALAEAQLATRLAPKSYTAHKVLGDILKEQKKLSQATAAYEVAEMMRQAKK